MVLKQLQPWERVHCLPQWDPSGSQGELGLMRGNSHFLWKLLPSSPSFNRYLQLTASSFLFVLCGGLCLLSCNTYCSEKKWGRHGKTLSSANFNAGPVPSKALVHLWIPPFKFPVCQMVSDSLRPNEVHTTRSCEEKSQIHWGQQGSSPRAALPSYRFSSFW